jgi:hypothetical protein
MSSNRLELNTNKTQFPVHLCWNLCNSWQKSAVSVQCALRTVVKASSSVGLTIAMLSCTGSLLTSFGVFRRCFTLPLGSPQASDGMTTSRRLSATHYTGCRSHSASSTCRSDGFRLRPRHLSHLLPGHLSTSVDCHWSFEPAICRSR